MTARLALSIVATLPLRGLSYLRGFPRPALLLVVATLIESTGRFMVVPYLSLRMHDAGVPLGTLGLVLAAAPFASVVFGAWGGSLSDRWGRKPVQVAGVATSGLALIGFAFAGSNPLILGSLNFLNGMTRTFYRPATNAALADHCPADRRSEAFALNRIALNAAFGWGPLIGVAVFAAAPRLGFLLGGALNLTAGLFVALAVPESAPALRPGPSAGPRSRVAGGWKAVLGDGTFLLWTAGMTLVWGAYDLIQSYLPLHFQAEGLPLTIYGAALSVNALVCVFVQLPFSRALRSAPIGPSASWSKLGYAAGLLGFAFFRSPWLLLLSMLVLSLGEVWGSAVQVRFLPERAPPELLGRYQGFSVTTELGRALVAPLAGLGMARFGGEAVFAGAALLSLAGALLLRLSGDRQDREAPGRKGGSAVDIRARPA